MKGIIPRKVTAVCGAGLLAVAATGCYTYHDLVDPCYPERYAHVSREEVKAALAPQVNNGHVLDQTVWNYYFEPGTAKLTPGGIQRLNCLSQRQPLPDPVVYLQTARDVPYDQARPEQFAQVCQDLDKRRGESVKLYLQVRNGGKGTTFEVVVHDPPEVGMSGAEASHSLQLWIAGAQGVLATGGAGGAAGAAGGASGLSSPSSSSGH